MKTTAPEKMNYAAQCLYAQSCADVLPKVCPFKYACGSCQYAQWVENMEVEKNLVGIFGPARVAAGGKGLLLGALAA